MNVMQAVSVGGGITLRGTLRGLKIHRRTPAGQVATIDAQLTDRFRQHEAAEILLSVPGFGPVLAATFLANIGGNLNGFDTVDRLAAVAGLAPVPYDSGRISGNLHRPRRFNRRLCAPVTSPHSPVLRTVRPRAPSTTASVENASPTNKH